MPVSDMAFLISYAMRQEWRILFPVTDIPPSEFVGLLDLAHAVASKWRQLRAGKPKHERMQIAAAFFSLVKGRRSVRD
jgi:hypothetical protein